MRNVCIIPSLLLAFTIASAHAQQPGPSPGADVPATAATEAVDVPAQQTLPPVAASSGVVVHKANHSHSYLWWEVPLAVVVVPVELAMVVIDIPVCIVGAVAHKDLCMQ